jgi:CBS domain-containing protein
MKAIGGELRGNTFELRLVGIDELLVKHDSPLLEACNTSFQVHLQVSPDNFVDYYNCALALTAPCLAIASNSPIVFGKRLWHETRIALFQQAIDTRKTLDHMRQMSPRVTLGNNWIEHSVLDIFKEDIARFRVLMHAEIEEDSLDKISKNEVPKLKALQLHNSTIYRWNRPCYGISDNGKPHLRIENRIFPSGPTILDQMANTAFWLGAMVGMKKEYGSPKKHMSYEDVRDNFGKSARFGIDSKFTWFRDQKLTAKELILQELLPLAKEGLKTMNIVESDISKYLDVIEQRSEKHMTGARWMLRSYTNLTKELTNKDEALTILAASIYDNQNKPDFPVHQWVEPTMKDYTGYRADMFNVSEFMETDLYTSEKNDLVILVEHLMRWKDFSYMPVEDKKGNLIGLVSFKTITESLEKENQKKKPKNLVIKDIMEKSPIVIGPNESITTALGLMRAHNLDCLPVVKDKELVGLLTAANLVLVKGIA